MSEQLQLRRGTGSQVASFTGAAGEVVFDTTNNRLVANDGVTIGGNPAAKLSEVITNSRTAVSDAAYTVLATDRMVAYIALTAARVVTLPASSAYPSGTRLLIVDETGNCSVTKTLTITANGTDAIDGAASEVVNQAYGFIGLESNQTGQWIIVDEGFIPALEINRGRAAWSQHPDRRARNAGHALRVFEQRLAPDPSQLHRACGRRPRDDGDHWGDIL